MDNKALLEATGHMIDRKLDPMMQDVSDLKQDVSGLKQDAFSPKQSVAVIEYEQGGRSTPFTKDFKGCWTGMNALM